MTDRSTSPRRPDASQRTRRRHPASGSRVAVAVLSVGAAAGLMISMGTADARSADAATASVPVADPPPVLQPAPRQTILLPVPRATIAAPLTTTTTTQPVATPQPIRVEPEKPVVVVQSGGSH